MNEIIQTSLTNDANQNAAELRSCGVCDFQSEMPVETRLCPNCDEPTLLKAETVALHGTIMAFLGGILMFMGFILIMITKQSFERAGRVKPKYALPEFQPPPPYAEFIVYSILGGMFCIGLSFFIAGAVQAYTQRRNIALLNWSIRLTNFLFLFCNLLMYLFS